MDFCNIAYSFTYISFFLLLSTIKHKVCWLIWSIDHRILRCYNDRGTQEIDITQKTQTSSLEALSQKSLLVFTYYKWNKIIFNRETHFVKHERFRNCIYRKRSGLVLAYDFGQVGYVRKVLLFLPADYPFFS